MKNYPLISFLTVFLCLPIAHAQEEVFDYNLNSPYDTIVTYLGYLKKGNYHPEIAAKAFSQEYRTQQDAAVLAIELYSLLKERKVDIDLSQVPKDKHYVDPKAKYHKYQLTQEFPEIYLAKVNDQWHYSEETALSIEALYHKKTYPLGIKKLSNILPHSLNKSFLGLHLWQHALLLLLFLFVTGVYKTFVFLFERWAYQFLEQWITSQVLTIKRCISSFITLLVLMLSLPTIQLPAALEQSAIRLLKGILTLSITTFCYEWINILAPDVGKRHNKRHAQKKDNSICSLCC
jgi:MscS family membrane protein